MWDSSDSEDNEKPVREVTTVKTTSLKHATHWLRATPPLIFYRSFSHLVQIIEDGFLQCRRIFDSKNFSSLNRRLNNLCPMLSVYFRAYSRATERETFQEMFKFNSYILISLFKRIKYSSWCDRLWLPTSLLSERTESSLPISRSANLTYLLHLVPSLVVLEGKTPVSVLN
jgi:hypothetical protein